MRYQPTYESLLNRRLSSVSSLAHPYSVSPGMAGLFAMHKGLTAIMREQVAENPA
jgi:hypothetical protein